MRAIFKTEFESNRTGYEVTSGTYNDVSETRYFLFGICIRIYKQTVLWEDRKPPTAVGFNKKQIMVHHA